MSKRKSNLKWCEARCYYYGCSLNHKHKWELIGVTSNSKEGVFAYFKCTRCQKWKRERIEYVIGGESNV